MRKSLWIMLAVMVVAVSAPNAHADSYAVTFTCNGCAVPAPTAPDVTFPSPSLFVTFDGFVFDLPAFPSNFLPGDTYIWGTGTSCFDPGGGNPQMCTGDLGIGDTSAGSEVDVEISTGSTVLSGGAGEVTFTPVATAPEPGSAALMLLGVGLVLRMRRSPGGQLAT